MASLQDPRIKLETLAEKQMKCCLHARFIENCRAADIIPKGLRLKLQMNVGPDSNGLQKSVDALLHKVSGEICDRVCDEYLRKSRDIGILLENTRSELAKSMSANELFTIDIDIYEKQKRRSTPSETRK